MLSRASVLHFFVRCGAPRQRWVRQYFHYCLVDFLGGQTYHEVVPWQRRFLDVPTASSTEHAYVFQMFLPIDPHTSEKRRPLAYIVFPLVRPSIRLTHFRDDR